MAGSRKTTRSKSSRQVAAYRKRLDDVLLQNSVTAFVEFMVGQGLTPPNLATAEVTMHKVITASKGLPMEVRRRSKAWLTLRGSQPLDDGDV